MTQPEPVNILMVDDQPAKLLTYRAILEDLGENLVGVESGREALEQLLKTEFSMILVDVHMPDQDGFELVEMIRQHPRFQKIPIIFVSAVQVTDLEKNKAYLSGAVDFVSVPVVPIVLRAKVAVFAELFRKTRDLERFNQDLEARVQERTEELNRTQRALLKIDRRKDEFLAILAHELRNPLAPMQSSIDVLRILKRNEPEIDEISDTLARQLKAMTHLIDDLMDMSRITRNKLELRKENTTIKAVVAQALEIVKPKIEAHCHNLTVELSQEEVFAHLDTIRISQVIANLLSNACKYTPKGGDIHLKAYATGTDTYISVTDNGIGIDESEQESVFEPFYQVREAKEMAQGGLGIGLALAKRIVELHGGSIRLDSSEARKGSTFVLQLPQSTSDYVEHDSPEVMNTEAVIGHRRKVLVIDDNVDAAQVLSKLLGLLGCDVETGQNGVEACELVNSYEPDIVLMDIGMPIMNGMEATKKIRQTPLGKDMTILALTGWGQSDDRRQTKEAGFDGHLIKPVTLADLKSAIESAPALR